MTRFLVTVEALDNDVTDETMGHIADTATLTMEVEADSNFEALMAAPDRGVVT